MRHTILVSLTLFSGCMCGPGEVVIRGQDAGSDAGNSTLDAGAQDAGTDAGSVFDAGMVECTPPDVLIALDRTLTMHRMADGTSPPDTDAGRATSKWSMAITAIEQLTTAPLDQSVRFGLELWPREETGCVTLSQRLQGTNATNTSCQGPEIPVPPALSSGATISALLDPDTTRICLSTPTGDALIGARTFLETNRVADGGAQFVVLVTDGADWDFSCPSPNPLGVVDGLADVGIQTLIVGFSAEMSLQNGVGAAFLNDMACAGRTAKNFATACVADTSGNFRARNPDAGGMNALFYTATNANELVTTLRDFTKTVCCGCIN